jgi:hypothetical protein
MKQLCCVVVAACLSLFAAAVAAAPSYRLIAAQDGVEVLTAFDPFGPNNQITAHVKFVNTNGYRVKITWNPVVTCKEGPAKNGYGAPFGLEAGASYEVSLWRTSTCSIGSIKDLSVEMEVKRADLYGQ